MKWYENPDGSIKAHRRPFRCKHCRENPKGACALPFRVATKKRYWERTSRMLGMKMWWRL